MIDFGPEENFGGDEGVLFWEEKLEGEESSFVGGVSGAGNLNEEVPCVGLWGLRVDADDGLRCEPLRLLHDPGRNTHVLFFKLFN